jgi:hypothetical protein
LVFINTVHEISWFMVNKIFSFELTTFTYGNKKNTRQNYISKVSEVFFRLTSSSQKMNII